MTEIDIQPHVYSQFKHLLYKIKHCLVLCGTVAEIKGAERCVGTTFLFIT